VNGAEIVFFLEERSAESLLSVLLPRILPPEIVTRFIVFEGKQDLEKRLERKLRGYLNPHAKFIVLRDKDAAPCINTKATLAQKCTNAGHPEAVVRIACHELESWYLADLAAVEKALERHGLAAYQNQRKYRTPDALASPSRELTALAPQYQKVGGSRLIGQHLDPTNTRSNSFRVFVQAVLQCSK
jgi:hypothetical protein